MIKEQKGLKETDIFVLTDDTMTEAWVHIGFPGYDEHKMHVVIEEDADMKAVFAEAVQSFMRTHKTRKFSYEESEVEFVSTGDSELDAIIFEMQNGKQVDSWKSVFEDVKENVGERVGYLGNVLKDNFGEKASELKDTLKSNLTSRFTRRNSENRSL